MTYTCIKRVYGTSGTPSSKIQYTAENLLDLQAQARTMGLPTVGVDRSLAIAFDGESPYAVLAARQQRVRVGRGLAL